MGTTIKNYFEWTINVKWPAKSKKYNNTCTNYSLQESWVAPFSSFLFSPSSPSSFFSPSLPLCPLHWLWAGHAPLSPNGGSARHRGDPRWTGQWRSWNSKCLLSHPGYEERDARCRVRKDRDISKGCHLKQRTEPNKLHNSIQSTIRVLNKYGNSCLCTQWQCDKFYILA